MKNLKPLITILVFFSMLMTYSQEYEFGEVSKEELLEKTYPFETSANAAVLYENKRVRYEYYKSEGFQLITEVHKRIKLYNRNGFENATRKIVLYNRGRAVERISGLKATTYSLIDDTIIETKLKKDGIFKTELSENYEEVSFTMPSLQEGSIIEYKYKIISPFLFNIGRIYLQYDIPIKKIDVEVLMPEFYGFKKFTTGYLPINLKESYVTSYGFKRVSHKINSQNVPSFKVEPFSGNIQNYQSSVVYELGFIKYRNGRVRNYATTWEDATKDIFSSSRFGNELKKTNYYKHNIDRITEGLESPLDKITAVYNHVKKKVEWNKNNSVYTRKGVVKAYQDGKGNSAEINLMLTSMISSLGYNANPVILNTGNRVRSLFPTQNGFNYVITRVKLPSGETLYLDAADEFAQPNVLSDRVIKGMGRVIAENGSSQMVDLRPEKPALNRFSARCKIDESGSVEGMLNIHHLDHFAHDFRAKQDSEDEKEKLDRLKRSYEIDELVNYDVKEFDEYEKGVVERFNFSCSGQVEMIDNEMFFAPLLFLRSEENAFKSNTRKYPVDFGHGYSNQYMLNIEIPKGYEVAEIPDALTFKLPNDIGQFSYRINLVNDNLQIAVDETINEAVITSEHYAELKQFYNQIIKKENDQVVLKRI